jgi:hypothetical protein
VGVALVGLTLLYAGLRTQPSEVRAA